MKQSTKISLTVLGIVLVGALGLSFCKLNGTSNPYDQLTVDRMTKTDLFDQPIKTLRDGENVLISHPTFRDNLFAVDKKNTEKLLSVQNAKRLTLRIAIHDPKTNKIIPLDFLGHITPVSFYSSEGDIQVFLTNSPVQIGQKYPDAYALNLVREELFSYEGFTQYLLAVEVEPLDENVDVKLNIKNG